MSLRVFVFLGGPPSVVTEFARSVTRIADFQDDEFHLALRLKSTNLFKVSFKVGDSDLG